MKKNIKENVWLRINHNSKKVNVLKDPTDETPEIVTSLTLESKFKMINSTPFYGFNDKPYVKIQTDNMYEGYVLEESIDIGGRKNG